MADGLKRGAVFIAIREYEEAYTKLDHHVFPTGPQWSADLVEAELAGKRLMEFRCTTYKQLQRWHRYVMSMPELRRKVNVDKVHSLSLELRRAEHKGRTREIPCTTYEIGIEGSDRLKIEAGPSTGHNLYHKRYPLDVMEIGESFIAPGLTNRAQIGGTLASGTGKHGRWYKTEKTDVGLRVTRIDKPEQRRANRKPVQPANATEPGLPAKRAREARRIFEGMQPDDPGRPAALAEWRQWRLRAQR